MLCLIGEELNVANEKQKNASAAMDAGKSSKMVIDGLASNAFRVVGVGNDIVLESYYLYPDFSSMKDGQTIEFNMDPEPDSEPNLRLIMNREVAARLTNALIGTLNAQMAQQPQAAPQPEPAGAGV